MTVSELAVRQSLCYTLAALFLIVAVYAGVSLYRLILASGARGVWTRQKSVHALVLLATIGAFIVCIMASVHYLLFMPY